MSSHLPVTKTMELLESLRETVRECTAREADLTQKHQRTISALFQRKQAASEAIRERLAAGLKQVQESFEAAKSHGQSRFGDRKARIINALKASREQALERIESQEGRRKYKLQTETMQITRARKESLAATETAHQDFQAQLAAENEALTSLELAASEAFKGYPSFRRLLSSCEKSDPDLAPDEYQLIAKLRELRDKSDADLKRFSQFALPRFFKYYPGWLALVGAQFLAVPALQFFKITAFGYREAAVSSAALLIAGTALHYMGKRKTLPIATEIARTLIMARKIHDACAQKTEVRYQAEIARIEGEFETRSRQINEHWGQAVSQSEESRDPALEKVDQKYKRICEKHDRFYRTRLERLAQAHAHEVERLECEAERAWAELERTSAAQESEMNAQHQSQWQALERDWKSKTQPVYDEINQANEGLSEQFPPWRKGILDTWQPPQNFIHAVKFARLDVDVAKLSEGLPVDQRLALPGPAQFSAPLLLTYPQQGSVLFQTSEAGQDAVMGALNNIILRLLSKAPPGRLNFTIFDPVGLGQNFAGIMHLADYEEHLINSRIWTQSAQIEQKLADLNEHMEKVIQMYLRNEYATIAEYNEQAGNIAEKYHFLVVANFPAGFTDSAIKRLMSIAASGARCGVYTLIHWDHRQTAMADFVSDELKENSVCITYKGNKFLLSKGAMPGASLALDEAPAPEFAIEFTNKIGRASRDSNRVEVPFSHVAPPEGELWTQDTAAELRVALGRAGATKLQYMAIGKGTRQHALVAGKTGSGKSTLFHVIITNLALWCSPEQVEFYLVDFKKGVEFKCYAAQRLPHARVVAIESDREFGLSVLQRVDAELKRRGDMFRNLGVQDIAGYKRAGGKEPIPRSLLIIDEFQEFFVEDDKIAQTASLLLDRIVRQGRAFGIHVILGSQTLGGAYSMARTTLGQMVIRVALQCNEADSYLIMDENNSAPRLLSRPGEGIYNDEAGAMEGNSPFQTVWLPDEVRETYLKKVRARADASQVKYPDPIVFEGDAPADIRENPLIRGLLEAPAIVPRPELRTWLGAPNSIKGPTEALFQRQSASNLLVVGQRDEAVVAMLATALTALSAQRPPGSVRFILTESGTPGSPAREYLERIIAGIPHPVTVAKNGDLGEVLGTLAQEMRNRGDNAQTEAAPSVFVLVHDLQKFTKLRYEEDFAFASADSVADNPAVLLNNLICEGASRGIHVIATCDSYNNVTRFMSRKALSEFGMRVLFQMSANDSASLIDNPKASTLGLHRALFFNDQEGYLEVFRPYALPGSEWIEHARQQLARLAGK